MTLIENGVYNDIARDDIKRDKRKAKTENKIERRESNDCFFKLDESFVDKYIGRQPDWGPLGYITYKRTYARKIVDDTGRETTEEFWQTTRRVVEGCFTIQKIHCKSMELPWDEEKAQRSARKMFDKIWNFKFLPPGRGLWIMGTEHVYKHGSMALNNCGFVSTKNLKSDKTKPFEFMMDASMLGVGVGFDTLGAGSITIKKPVVDNSTYVIPDSREGWVSALRILLNAFFDGDVLPEFIFDEIIKGHPKGSPIRGFGGVAAGHEPLAELLDSIKTLLFRRVGISITSVDIVDIMNFIGKCVVSGNVRRSAQIALGMPDDDGFVTMKNKSKYSSELKSHRWASNNSIVVDPNVGFDYTKVCESIAENGEPGIVWIDNARKYSRMGTSPDYKDRDVCGVNPCAEQSLESYELCCLVETFPSRHDSYEEFQETLKMAYLYAKSVTLMRTHWVETNAVMLKNRRIGTSVSGIIDAMTKHGRRMFLTWLSKGYEYLKNLDEIYSNWLCVPRSIKITTVKPSGTTSLLAGVSPGIHYPHSEYYIRRIRLADNSDLKRPLIEAGYHVEPSATGERNTVVVSFPMRVENFDVGKKDASMEMQIMNAIDVQKYWSDNQVSITVTFNKNEAKRLKSVLSFCEDKLKCVSFMPLFDHDYVQAPYEEISREKYEEMISRLKPINWNTIEEGHGVTGCDGDRCTL